MQWAPTRGMAWLGSITARLPRLSPPLAPRPVPHGLHGHRVDWLRGRIEVVDVMTRRGLRQWPKLKRSHRVVPLSPGLLEAMSVLMSGRPRDALVFTAPGGGPIDDGHFRTRVWYPVITAAGVRRFPQRIMRHTAASWLVQDGVPLYDVQALLGHEDYSTTLRYGHLRPGEHGKVIESWLRHTDASVTHRPEGPSLMTRKGPLTWVGVAGFEPAASSSRTRGAAGRLVVVPASSVCWRSCWLAAARGRCCTSALYCVPHRARVAAQANGRTPGHLYSPSG